MTEMTEEMRKRIAEWLDILLADSNAKPRNLLETIKQEDGVKQLFDSMTPGLDFYLKTEHIPDKFVRDNRPYLEAHLEKKVRELAAAEETAIRGLITMAIGDDQQTKGSVILEQLRDNPNAVETVGKHTDSLSVAEKAVEILASLDQAEALANMGMASRNAAARRLAQDNLVHHQKELRKILEFSANVEDKDHVVEMIDEENKLAIALDLGVASEIRELVLGKISNPEHLKVISITDDFSDLPILALKKLEDNFPQALTDNGFNLSVWVTQKNFTKDLVKKAIGRMTDPELLKAIILNRCNQEQLDCHEFVLEAVRVLEQNHPNSMNDEKFRIDSINLKSQLPMDFIEKIIGRMDSPEGFALVVLDTELSREARLDNLKKLVSNATASGDSAVLSRTIRVFEERNAERKKTNAPLDRILTAVRGSGISFGITWFSKEYNERMDQLAREVQKELATNTLHAARSFQDITADFVLSETYGKISLPRLKAIMANALGKTVEEIEAVAPNKAVEAVNETVSKLNMDLACALASERRLDTKGLAKLTNNNRPDELIAYLTRKNKIGQTLETLETLAEGGVDITSAIETLIKTARENDEYTNRKRAANAIRWQAANARAIPPEAVAFASDRYLDINDSGELPGIASHILASVLNRNEFDNLQKERKARIANITIPDTAQFATTRARDTPKDTRGVTTDTILAGMYEKIQLAELKGIMANALGKTVEEIEGIDPGKAVEETISRLDVDLKKAVAEDKLVGLTDSEIRANENVEEAITIIERKQKIRETVKTLETLAIGGVDISNAVDELVNIAKEHEKYGTRISAITAIRHQITNTGVIPAEATELAYEIYMDITENGPLSKIAFEILEDVHTPIQLEQITQERRARVEAAELEKARTSAVPEPLKTSQYKAASALEPAVIEKKMIDSMSTMTEGDLASYAMRGPREKVCLEAVKRITSLRILQEIANLANFDSVGKAANERNRFLVKAMLARTRRENFASGLKTGMKTAVRGLAVAAAVVFFSLMVGDHTKKTDIPGTEIEQVQDVEKTPAKQIELKTVELRTAVKAAPEKKLVAEQRPEDKPQNVKIAEHKEVKKAGVTKPEVKAPKVKVTHPPVEKTVAAIPKSVENAPVTPKPAEKVEVKKVVEKAPTTVPTVKPVEKTVAPAETKPRITEIRPNKDLPGADLEAVAQLELQIDIKTSLDTQNYSNLNSLFKFKAKEGHKGKWIGRQDSNDDKSISNLQLLLRNIGYYEVEITGQYDKNTEQTVREVQKTAIREGIVLEFGEDGKFGTETWNALQQHLKNEKKDAKSMLTDYMGFMGRFASGAKAGSGIELKRIVRG